MYADIGGVSVPNELTDGCFINYPDIDLSDPRFNKSSVSWQTLYYKDNYPRLQQVKARWTPATSSATGSRSSCRDPANTAARSGIASATAAVLASACR